MPLLFLFQAVFDNDVDYLEILLDQAVAAMEEEAEARAGTALEGVGGGAPVRATTHGRGSGGGRARMLESCRYLSVSNVVTRSCIVVPSFFFIVCTTTTTTGVYWCIYCTLWRTEIDDKLISLSFLYIFLQHMT